MFFQKKKLLKEFYYSEYILKVFDISKDTTQQVKIELVSTGLTPKTTEIEVKSERLIIRTSLQGQVDYFSVPLNIFALALKELGVKDRIIELMGKE